MKLIELCQFVVKPCETDLCRHVVYGAIALAFLVVVVCGIGLYSGEYQRREQERFKSVLKLRRKR